MKSSSSIILRLTANLTALLCVAPSLSQSNAPKEFWSGMYMAGKKIGYSSEFSQPSVFQGKSVTKITSVSIARIEMFGNKVSQDTRSVTYVDAMSKPIHQEYKISSNGSVMDLTADYQRSKIVCKIKSGTGVSSKTIEIPVGANLIADSSDPAHGKQLKVGFKTTFHYLNPLTIELDKTDVSVDSESDAKLNGKSVHVLKVAATSKFGNIISWETGDGSLVKGEMSFGPASMVIFGESKKSATDMASSQPTFVLSSTTASPKLYQPPSDFALATAITTATPIMNPRDVRSLRITVEGVSDKSLILSDSRQMVVPDTQTADTYVYEVNTSTLTKSSQVRLPILGSENAKFLGPAPYLEINDSDLKRTALGIRATETDAYKVACKVREWVHANMRPDLTIGVPRSCVEIYKKRRGVCRDYATIFAGLARAAGIPTRVVGGIVYADGKFFYHAWNECNLGDWLAFDSTMPVNDVDATHIKFAQGDVTDMFRVAGVIGKLKITVLEARQ